MLSALKRRFLENPLIGKELDTGLTSPRLGAVFTFVGAVYLATDLFCYVFFWDFSFYSPLEFSAGAFLHFWHTIVGYGVLIVLLPLRLSGHIEGARAGRAFDQVVVTGVSPLRMCLGNWALGLGYAALLLFVTLPYEVMAYVFGGVTVGQILASYGVLLLYANVIIGVTLGLAVVTTEWVVVPVTVLLLAVAGIVSGIPVVPAAVAHVGPLRFAWIQALSLGIMSEFPSQIFGSIQSAPRLFSLDIPAAIYAPLLWTCLLIPFVALIVLGPSHFFLPGFNVFGSVVLPGDSKRARFRRLRQGLVRRIEMAFYYENRPAWCERWDFAIRTFVSILVVALLWVGIFGVVYDTIALPRSFEDDWRFHTSFVLGSLALFFWILAVGQTRLWVLFRERVGRLNLTRGIILNLAFFALFAGLFFLQYAAFRTLEARYPPGSLAPMPAGQFEMYRLKWHAYVGVGMLLFFNIYLLSRVLAWLFQNPPTWRISVFLATNVLLWAPIVIHELASHRIDIFPPDMARVVFLSPFAILELEGQSLGERLQSCVTAHACLGAFLVLLWMLLWRWRREEARWPLLPSRVAPPRPSGGAGAGALVVLSCMLLSGESGLAQDALENAGPDFEAGGVAAVGETRGRSPERDLALDVVEIVRGFDGCTFSPAVDFLTVVVHNPSAESLSGRVRASVRFANRELSSAWKPVELPTRTNVVVRLDLFGRGWTSQELLLEFEADGRRLVVRAIDPLISVGQTALPARLEDGGKFLLVSEAPRRPVEWQRAMTGGAVVHIACRPLHLPENHSDYAGTSTVLIDSPDVSRWTSLQRSALYDYMRLGGSVILFGDVDVGRRESLEPWGKWLEGARTRPLEGPGGRYSIVELAEGETLLYLESRTGGEPLPLLNVRSIGPGRLGHLAFDPAEPSLPAALTGSSKFWVELTRRLPKSLHPIAFASADRRDAHLNDPTSLYLILGYFALYTLFLGPVLFYLFRQKSRRLWMWGYAGALTVVFGAGVYALDWVVHTHPSQGEIREMVYFGPGSREGLSYATVRLRSCGRQRHVLRVSGNRISAFDVQHDWRAQTLLPRDWMGPPVSDDVPRELSLDLAPWSARQFALVGETKFRSGVAGRATYDQKTKQVTYTIESTIEPEDGWFTLVSFNLDGKGTLGAHALLGVGAGVYTGTVSEDGSRSLGVGGYMGGAGYMGRAGDMRSTTLVYQRRWRTVLNFSGASTPRFLVGWSPGELKPGVEVSSDDVAFRREATFDSRSRTDSRFREFRRIDGDGDVYLLHQQLILQEIPLEVK